MTKTLVLASVLAFSALTACSDAGNDDGGEGGAGTGGGSAGTAGGGKGSGGSAGTAGKAGGSGGTSGNSSGSGGSTSGGSGGSAGSQSGGAGSGGAGSGSGGSPAAGSAGTGGTAGSGIGGSGGSGGTGAGGTSSGGESGNGQGGDGESGAGGSNSGGGTSGGGSGGGPNGTGFDPFGIRELYPSASSGAEWTSEHWEGEEYTISSRSDSNDPSGLSGMRGTGTLEVNDGELTMSGSQPRIYIYPPESGPWRDIEVTVYYQRVEDSDTAYAGLVIGARSGEDGHSSGSECDAHTYYARVRNDGAFDFEKELEHPASSTQSRVQPDDAWPDNDGEVPRNTWIGFKFVIYNLSGGDVKLEAYRDMTNGEDGGDWELVNETVDDGGWFVETSCSEHSPSGGESDMVVVDGGTTFIRNTDVDEALYRWVSVREIQAP